MNKVAIQRGPTNSSGSCSHGFGSRVQSLPCCQKRLFCQLCHDHYPNFISDALTPIFLCDDHKTVKDKQQKISDEDKLMKTLFFFLSPNRRFLGEEPFLHLFKCYSLSFGLFLCFHTLYLNEKYFSILGFRTQAYQVKPLKSPSRVT